MLQELQLHGNLVISRGDYLRNPRFSFLASTADSPWVFLVKSCSVLLSLFLSRPIDFLPFNYFQSLIHNVTCLLHCSNTFSPLHSFLASLISSTSEGLCRFRLMGLHISRIGGNTAVILRRREWASHMIQNVGRLHRIMWMPASISISDATKVLSTRGPSLHLRRLLLQCRERSPTGSGLYYNLTFKPQSPCQPTKEIQDDNKS